MTESRPAASASREGHRAFAHIPALDGLRGMAVALVLAYHFGVPGFGGGFLGVDLFFVLSGFLITTLLIHEWDGRAAIDLAQFWFRRARRLLPAVFVLLAVLAAWSSTASAYEKGPLRWDLLASLGYVANWRFIIVGESYFSEFATASPVRHLWSLAIEEQFYVAWPLIVFVALRVAASRRRGPLLVTGALIVATLLSTIILAATYDESDPSRAYFSTFARAHELLIGAGAAILAAHSPALGRLIDRHAGRLALVAVAGIVALGLVLSDASPAYFYGGSAAFSVAAAALILALVIGTRSTGLAHRALRFAPLVWLGTISYGVYLWHWPFTVWLDPASTGLDGPILFLARLGATLAVAAASFYVLERPIRRGSIRGVRLRPAAVVATAVVCVALLSAGTVLATRGSKPLPPFLSDEQIIRVIEAPQSRGVVGVVGDSVALSLLPGIGATAKTHHLGTVSAALGGCAIGETLRTEADGTLQWRAKRCVETTVDLQTQLVRDYDPKVIFWYSGRDRYDIRALGRTLQSGTEEWERALFEDWDRTLARLRSGGATVVLIAPLHSEGGDPATCSEPVDLSDPACVEPWATTGALRTVYQRWASGHPDDLVVIDLADRLCPAAPCPAAVDGVAMRRDEIHFVGRGARLVAGWLFGALPPGLLP
ncbi:MAG TPA: acyltransferase family protein [Methylomirabilota bacterium]|nr:acyltransferase family protein [Methylomirabilota bacterium]